MSHCKGIHSLLTADHHLNDGQVGKHSVVLEEYSLKYV